MKVKLLVACQDGKTRHKKRTVVEFEDEDYALKLCKQRMAREATTEEVKAAGKIPVIKLPSKPAPKSKPKAKKSKSKPAPKKDAEE